MDRFIKSARNSTRSPALTSHRFSILFFIRTATTIYAVFIALVVVSATSGWFPDAFAAVRRVCADWMLHFGLVGTLALLINLACCDLAAIPNVGAAGESHRLIRRTCLLIGLATFEEFSQLLFALRTFDWIDLLANAAGILMIGWGGCRLLMVAARRWGAWQAFPAPPASGT